MRDARRFSVRGVSLGVQRCGLHSTTWSGSTVMAHSGAAPLVLQRLEQVVPHLIEHPVRPPRPPGTRLGERHLVRGDHLIGMSVGKTSTRPALWAYR